MDKGIFSEFQLHLMGGGLECDVSKRIFSCVLLVLLIGLGFLRIMVFPSHYERSLVLTSPGHPIGATGLAQCAELNWQVTSDSV